MATITVPAYKTYPTFADPAYLIRQSVTLGAIKGNAATGKWVTHANMYVYGITTLIDVLGTSTYSSTKSSQSVQVTIIVNTDTTGTTVSLTTATWGPYAVGGPYVSTSTGTAFVGGVNYITLNTNTGAGGANYGGYYVPAGSEVVITLGTDATADIVTSIDYQLAPLAAVTA